MDHHLLDVAEGTQAVLETEWIVVVIVGFYEAGFIGFEILLWVHVVRVLLDLVGLGLLAEVDTLLQVVLHDVHLGDDALDAHQLVGHLAAQSSRGHEVGSEVPLEIDSVVFDLAIELGSLVSEESPFEIVFAEAVVFLWMFDEILCSLGVLLPELIDVDLDAVGVGGG